MYKVVTISKKTREEEGYLGEYDTIEEAEEVANRFNLKADRHPSIASVVELEDENFMNNFFSNPSINDDFFDEEEESSSVETTFNIHEDSEEESSEELFQFKEEPQIIKRPQIPQRYNRIKTQNDVQNTSYRENRSSYQQIQREHKKEPKTRTFTSLHSEQSTERIKSRNKREMEYNKDRFMFRDVGSSSSISSIRKTNSQPFMFAEVQHSIRGIIIHKNKVLIREPANHYDNVLWEFYGGTPEISETEEETVVREVKEETGYDTNVVKYVGDFTYKNKVLKFYLLEKIGSQQKWKDFETSQEETWSTKWVTKEQAWNYFKLNRNELYKRLLRNALDEAFHKYKLINMRY